PVPWPRRTIPLQSKLPASRTSRKRTGAPSLDDSEAGSNPCRSAKGVVLLQLLRLFAVRQLISNWTWPEPDPSLDGSIDQLTVSGTVSVSWHCAAGANSINVAAAIRCLIIQFP